MTMHGVVQNHIGQLPSAAVPWWSGIGSRSTYNEPFGQTKSSFLENPNSGGQLTANKRSERGIEQGMEKGNTTQFTIFPGNFLTYATLMRVLHLFYGEKGSQLLL